MSARIGRRLRTVFRGRPEEEPAVVETARGMGQAIRRIEFVAHGADFVASGRIQMTTDRLTDMLNAHDEYRLEDVLLERLGEGRASEVEEVMLQRHEVLVAHGAGPRGSTGQRRRTRAHAVAIRIGRYDIGGYLHVPPGADPIRGIRRREAMVPLTDAWIESRTGSSSLRRRVGVVVVNRDWIDWIVPVADDELEMPGLSISADQGMLPTDLTGALFDRP
jgi:hypothetical protein